jgi:hypothetical protein
VEHVRALLVSLWHGGPLLADDDAGRRAAPGIYFYRLTTAGSTLSRKLVLLD